MKRIRINFPSGELKLDGRLESPEGDGPFPAVIVCHPHSLHGGIMNNKVVYTIVQMLTEASIVALRFNFRGVGGSEGEFGYGIKEHEDVLAAISYLTTVKEVDTLKIGLAGYSFGAVVGMPVDVRDKRVKALAAISPPFPLSDFQFLMDSKKPKFLVLGDADQYTSRRDFLDFCSGLPDPKEFEVIAGADHFWGGHEPVFVGRVVEFFGSELKRG
jgi:uncharacterized protein